MKEKILKIIDELLDTEHYRLKEFTSGITNKTSFEILKELKEKVSLLDAQVMQKARLFAKIQLLGVSEPKKVPITNINFNDGQLFSVTVKYPLGNNYYDHLTYYFDGRKLGEEKDIDVSEIFKGFSA